MRKRHGFTLVELLVVITIILVLLALLAPAMDKAMDVAQRAVCGAKLHAFATAHSQYYFDHRRKLLKTLSPPNGDQGRYPFAVWGRVGEGSDRPSVGSPVGVVSGGGWNAYSATAISQQSEISADAINPYLGNPIDPQAHTVGRIFNCPSNAVNSFWLAPYGIYATNYSYFARVNEWRAGDAANAAPQELTEKSLDSGRLLMSDWIHYNSSSVAFDYNHPGGRDNADIQPLQGANQLYGDGHVLWKDMNTQEWVRLKSLMRIRDQYPNGYVKGPGTSAVYY